MPYNYRICHCRCYRCRPVRRQSRAAGHDQRPQGPVQRRRLVSAWHPVAVRPMFDLLGYLLNVRLALGDQQADPYSHGSERGTAWRRSDGAPHPALTDRPVASPVRAAAAARGLDLDCGHSADWLESAARRDAAGDPAGERQAQPVARVLRPHDAEEVVAQPHLDEVGRHLAA